MRRHPLATTCRFDPQMTRMSKSRSTKVDGFRRMGVTEARDEAIGATFEGHRRDDGQSSSRPDRPIVTTRSTDRHDDNYVSSRRQRVIDMTLSTYRRDDNASSARRW
jgi:hypothetical protein